MKKTLSLLIFTVFLGNAAFSQFYLMNNTPVTTCSGSFFDSGGPGGNYQNSEDFVKTFTPATMGQKIRVDFTSFHIESGYDYLYIYDGPDINSPLIGTYTHNDNPGTIISTAPNGELTFHFTSDNIIAHSGWVATISCVNPPAPPVNDNVCSATPLSVGAVGVYNYSTHTLIGATNSGNPAFCDNNNLYPQDVWFSFTVPASGRIDIRTQNITFTDGAISLYVGPNCSSLIEVACSGSGSGTGNNMGRILYTGLTPGTTAYIRVWKNGGGFGDFQIAAADFNPSITVIRPNGGEKFVVDTGEDIMWYSEGVDYVDIEYSTNNGATWNIITTNEYALNQYYYWNIPNDVSSQCLIRISETGNPALNDVSNSNFEIVYPYFEFTLPNGGEVFSTNQNVSFEWIYYGNITTINNLEISTNGGATWTSLLSNFPNFGYATVTLPATPSNNCLARISGTHAYGTTTNVSTSTFSIINGNVSIVIHTPQANEQYNASEGILITWEADPVITHIDIEVNDSGIPNMANNNNITQQRGRTMWYLLASNVPANKGFYYWTTDYINNNRIGRVRILPTNSPWFAEETGDFDIYVNPYVQITYPDMPETWLSGSYKTIYWNNAGMQSVNLEYKTSSNGPWITIANNITKKQYYWLVPNISTTQLYFKISDASNPNLFDTTYYAISIVNNAITNTTNTIYSGSLSICPGDEFSINYTATGTFYSYNTFEAQLSDANGSFANPIPIGNTIGNALNGVINVKIPQDIPNGSGYRMRVVSDNEPSIASNNGQNITISKPDSDFSASSQFKYLPDGQVNFTFTGNPSGITSYSWRFGDGATAGTQNPSHNYTQRGYYSVTLTTTSSSCNSTTTKQKFISVENLFDTDIINTPVSGDFLSVKFLDGVKGCIGMDNGNCLITLDSGLTWQNTPVGLTTKLTSVSIVPGFWIVTSDSGFVSYSTNGGVTWTAMNIGTTENLRGSAFKTSSNGYVVGENGTIFKYDGSSWTQEYVSTTNHLNSIAFSDDDVVVVGDNGTIIRSPLGNGTWNFISSPYNSDLNAITFNSNFTGIAAGQFGRIIRTTDGGQTWSPSLPFEYTWFKSVEMNVDSAWAVGTNGIVYQSLDAGLTWVRGAAGTNNNLNNIVFYGTEQRSLLQANNPDYIFERAQAPNRGYVVGNNGTARVFGEPLVDTSSNVNNLLTFNIIFKVYPNPTSGLINIQAELKNQSQISISVKDVFGRSIENHTVSSNPGIFNKQIDLSKLPVGYYFIEINTDNHKEIHRLVISR